MHFLQPIEQQVEVVCVMTQDRSEAEDVIAECAEHNAVAACGFEEAIAELQRCIESLFGFLICNQFECAEQATAAGIADKRVLEKIVQALFDRGKSCAKHALASLS